MLGMANDFCAFLFTVLQRTAFMLWTGDQETPIVYRFSDGIIFRDNLANVVGIWVRLFGRKP